MKKLLVFILILPSFIFATNESRPLKEIQEDLIEVIEQQMLIKEQLDELTDKVIDLSNEVEDIWNGRKLV